jgi:hypothetical protein
MRLTYWIILGCCASMLGGPLTAGSMVRAQGAAKAEAKIVNVERPVSGFHTIALVGVGKVQVRQTGKESVTVKAAKGLESQARVEVQDHTLILIGAPGEGPTEFIVEAKDLQGLVLSGTGSMKAREVKTKRLAVTLSGTGTVSASGKADVLRLAITGTGDFLGEYLKTEQVSVEHTGIGKAVVNVHRDLDATIKGIGSVEFIGSPRVRQSVLGLGQVVRRR